MEVLKFTFLLIKYSVRTILIEWTNLLRIKCLNISGFLNIRGSRLEESCKKVFLTFLQNSLKISKMSVMQSLILNFKLIGPQLFEKRLRHMCFPKNFAEVLRTPILQNADRLLLLKDLRMRISCFLVLKFWQILWKIPAKDFTSVVILQVTEYSEHGVKVGP